jgi:hypothetical protein
MTFKLIYLLVFCTVLFSCAQQRNATSTPGAPITIISEVTTSQTLLNKKDVTNYFCSTLTEYFNTYKYYRISSEIYSEKEKQNSNATSRIIKQGALYNVEYIGSSGKYLITFSSKEFSESDQIFTFGQGTVLGNAIRRKVYDTYVSWLKRVEINLKATGNTAFYPDELNAAIELEKWHNGLNQVQQ